MKTIAFYLPQFHAIPENDMWWGKGFTEWVNVKKTYPRFWGHYQPRVPLNNNYYCLLDKQVLIEQAKLAKEYCIDAFCFYQYWFGEKMLLEKPIEIVRDNREIDIEYCLSWANESWTNHWNGGDRNIIIEQTYGGKERWRKQFDYLYTFFCDDRYIKVDGKPVYIIYHPYEIPNLNEMIKYWNELAIKSGFKGIYIGIQDCIQHYSEYSKECIDFEIEYEPHYTAIEIQQINNDPQIIVQKILQKTINKLLKKPYIYSYDFIWKRILRRKRHSNRMAGIFPDWDNSPRHINDNRGLMFYKSTPQKFGKYCTKLLDNYRNKFVFINAWNEWAEGAYMEPDEKYQYEYLEQYRDAVLKGKKER